MEFVHHAYQPEETIAAIATPPGEGGVAIIRVSGRDAVEVAGRVFSGPVRSYKSHTAHYGHLLDAEGGVVDDVLLLPMLNGRSYTGEDVVEIHCHGGSFIARAVLNLVLQAGARAARPGEFTFRAFMNGRLDMAQAEAVQVLIAAKNEHAMHSARQQLEGRLSRKVAQLQEQLTEVAAILEAWVDFPEEGLEFASMEEICQKLEGTQGEMQLLIDTFDDGRIVHEGLSLCLVGCPNVGKSSLMNALLERDRSIVSPIPGTTRDLVEDGMRLNGLHLRLVDTAGLRDTEDLIEQEGVRRTREAMAKADLILLILDASREVGGEERKLLDEVPKERVIIVWNKGDLTSQAPASLPFPHIVQLSAKERWGIEELTQEIDRVIWRRGAPSREEVLITNVRHREALSQALANSQRVGEGLKTGVSPEFLTLDMRQSLSELGKIIGTNITEDILSAIFSKFCIGK